MRKNIGIFGKMNAGKSTLMNLLTQQETSIVDSTPGTTTDIKVAMMEIHELGPVKIFDTAGLDEEGPLGDKKRLKSEAALNESDTILVVIEPYKQDLTIEKRVMKMAKGAVFIVYNLFANKKYDTESVQKELGYPPHLALDLTSKSSLKEIISLIKSTSRSRQVDLLPPNINRGDIVFLNIPMDMETPRERLLRPQARVQEALLRNSVATFAYRMDLKNRAAQGDFLMNIDILRKSGRLKLLITDSQAIDVVDRLVKDVPVTTFSIVMINEQSGGRLDLFRGGIEALSKIKGGDRILILEACNHDRIGEDIGTVQIPQKIVARFGNNVVIDHAYGREIEEIDLESYKVIIHCGGCMVDSQKIQARIEKISSLGIAITNYGMVLAYLHSPATLERILQPWCRNRK